MSVLLQILNSLGGPLATVLISLLNTCLSPLVLVGVLLPNFHSISSLIY